MCVCVCVCVCVCLEREENKEVVTETNFDAVGVGWLLFGSSCPTVLQSKQLPAACYY